jgi:thiamine biosynthesis lipoprotein
MSLDFGGIGREYAVDAVAAMIRRAGGESVFVDFGQDVAAFGAPPDGTLAWRVGLEDPRRPGQCWGGVQVRDLAVSTSGDCWHRAALGGHHHGQILDVRAGRPVAHGARAVSVVASRSTLAGVLATAAYVLGPAEGLRLLDTLPGVAGCVLTDTLTLQTRSFHDYLAA